MKNSRRFAYFLLPLILISRVAFSDETALPKDDHDELYKAAQKSLEEGQYESARAFFFNYLQEHPDSVEGNKKLGFIYLQLDNVGDAVIYLEKAVDLGATDPSTYLILATAYNRHGDFDKALEAYRQTILKSPSSSTAYHEMGLIYYRRNDMQKSVEMLRKALEISNGSPVTMLALGMALVKANHSEQAVEYVTALREQGEEVKANQLESIMRYRSESEALPEPGAENLTPPVANPNTKDS